MRRLSIIIFIVAALMTGSLSFAQTTGDRDGDGVGDSRDRCPDVAGPTELMGCPADADGDGTFDFEDACPAEGGHANNRGCPILPDPTPAPEATTAAPSVNPNLPLASGPCTASTYLTGRVNGRNYPGASGEIVAQLDPNVLYPVLGLIALPDEAETYLVITMEDVLISSYSIPSTSAPMAFDPAFMGGVFVAASTMNIGGDCGPQETGLLLPAVQAAREAARRASASSTDEPAGYRRPLITVRKAGGRGDDYYKVTLSDLLISSLADADGDPAAGAGKVSLQDFHFVIQIVEGEDGGQGVFDLVDAEPGTEANDYLLTLDGIPGESKDVPPATDAFWMMITSVVQPDGESCEGTLLDELAALGGELGVAPAGYGFDLVATLPAGVEPGQIEPCLPGDGSVIPSDQFSLNFTKIKWEALGDGSVRTSLVKVGPGTLAFGGVGLSEDGAVCVDLQPVGAQPLCVPNALPAVQ